MASGTSPIAMPAGLVVLINLILALNFRSTAQAVLLFYDYILRSCNFIEINSVYVAGKK